jgi:hypothetical protein
VLSKRQMIAPTTVWLIVAVSVFPPRPARASGTPQRPSTQSDRPKPTQGVVPFDVTVAAEPSGWMGDGELGTRYVSLDTAWKDRPHSPPACIKASYLPGPARWAGIFWQTEPNNWGDKPGVDYAGRGVRRLTFWARGEAGNEVVEFKVGGVDEPSKRYRDSLSASTGVIVLRRDWQRFVIDLRGKDLSSVINAFGWVVSANRNVGAITFYLDDILYE